MIRSAPRPFAILAAAVAAGCFVHTASATPITVNGINMFRDYRGNNLVGVTSGDRMQYGANVVGGSLGTSLGAVYPPSGFTDPAVPCAPLAVNANFCSNSVAFNASRIASPWQFRFTNGPDLLLVNGPSLAGTDFRVPIPTSVAISSSGLTPTISWALPAGYVPDGFRIQVYDMTNLRANGTADVVYATAVPEASNSFTIPVGVLSLGHPYTINFQIIETRGNIPFTNSNTQILTRSNSFFPFFALGGGNPNDRVFLPQVGQDPDPNDDRGAPFEFVVDDIRPGVPIRIDPLVATGYDYASGATDPNFESVQLPDVGDGVYRLSYFALGGLQTATLLAGDQFFFPAGGVSAFSILGIETGAGLDPLDPTAFITTLTFVGAGSFTGSMTPIVAEVPGVLVPASGTAALLMPGIIALARMRKRARPAAARRE